MKNSIKVERAKKNITQADLAILAKVSRQTINAMELGKYVPSTVLSLRLAHIFEVEVSQIFTLEDSDWDQEVTSNGYVYGKQQNKKASTFQFINKDIRRAQTLHLTAIFYIPCYATLFITDFQ